MTETSTKTWHELADRVHDLEEDREELIGILQALMEQTNSPRHLLVGNTPTNIPAVIQRIQENDQEYDMVEDE